MKKNKTVILLSIHLFIFISMCIITYMGVMTGAGEGQLGEDMVNLGYFKAFTMDSNILSGIASLVVSICLIRNLITKKDTLPYGVVLFQYISAVAVGLTIVVVITFLAPSRVVAGQSYFLSFYGDMFFFHLLNPILAGCMFIFGEKQYVFRRKENLLGLIPAFIYSMVYLYCVVIQKIWEDFYGFTFGGKNEAVAPVLTIIYVVSYGIGYALIKLHNKRI